MQQRHCLLQINFASGSPEGDWSTVLRTGGRKVLTTAGGGQRGQNQLYDLRFQIANPELF
jgi:phage terminase large subunit-like protein